MTDTMTSPTEALEVVVDSDALHANSHGGTSAEAPGYHDNKASHLKRLRRIEGQIRGLQRMVESDVYCIDVLTQVSAATRALEAVALGLLEDHLGHCVTHAIQSGGSEAETKIKEASAAIARLVRS